MVVARVGGLLICGKEERDLMGCVRERKKRKRQWERRLMSKHKKHREGGAVRLSWS
jgi:hypothetical protein